MQKSILEHPLEEKPPPGFGFIYRIQAPSKRCYVGKTTESVRARWMRHLKAWRYRRISGKRVRHCVALGNAIAKYGAERMQVSVLACVPLKELSAEEKRQIASCGSLTPGGYNLTPGGDGGPCSAEGRKRIVMKLRGRTYSAETLARMSAGHRGKIPGPETRAKMSAARLGKKHPPGTGAKIGAALRGKAKTAAHIQAIIAAHARRSPGSYHKHTEESRQRIAEALRRFHEQKRKKEATT